ncbi:PSAT1 [Symbiodinium sp. CCMP2456]|nr:PSAT1 [Symbiodinium sp. CCMP2456]
MAAEAGVAAASAAAVGFGLFDYNRANYLYDAEFRFERFSTGREYAVEQSNQFRNDLRTLSALTMVKNNQYAGLAALDMALCIALYCAGRLGLHGPSPPGWIMALWITSNAASFAFMALAILLALHASYRAQAASVNLLTRKIRVPVPSMRPGRAVLEPLSSFDPASSTASEPFPDLVFFVRTMARARAINLAAGAAALPLEVLERASAEFVETDHSGMSVAEMGYRTKPFHRIMERAESSFRELLSIPDTHEVHFFNGGATLQFSAIPLNLLGGRNDGKPANYLMSGHWSEKASNEARLFGNVKEVAEDPKGLYFDIPDSKTWNFDRDAAYFHYTSADTRQGLEIRNFDFDAIPAGMPVCCDASANLGSAPIDVCKYGVLYAASHKNFSTAGVCYSIIRRDLISEETQMRAIPTMCNWVKFQNAPNKIYNVPVLVSIWIGALNTEWMIERGGVAAFEELAIQRSQLLYDVIDNSNGFYRTFVDSEAFRSRMQVVFTIGSGAGNDHELVEKFLQRANDELGWLDIRSHPLGTPSDAIRVTMYNHQTLETIKVVREFMHMFQQEHASSGDYKSFLAGQESSQSSMQMRQSLLPRSKQRSDLLCVLDATSLATLVFEFETDQAGTVTGTMQPGGLLPADSAPEHFRLYAAVQKEWFQYDIYARVCMLLGFSAFVQSLAFYGNGHIIVELRAFYVAHATAFVIEVLHVLLLRFDIIQGRVKSTDRTPAWFLWLGPVSVAFATVGMSLDFRTQFNIVAIVFTWICIFGAYICQFCYQLRILEVILPDDVRNPLKLEENIGDAWWPASWRCPSAFAHVLYFVAPPGRLQPGQFDLVREVKNGPQNDAFESAGVAGLESKPVDTSDASANPGMTAEEIAAQVQYLDRLFDYFMSDQVHSQMSESNRQRVKDLFAEFSAARRKGAGPEAVRTFTDCLIALEGVQATEGLMKEGDFGTDTGYTSTGSMGSSGSSGEEEEESIKGYTWDGRRLWKTDAAVRLFQKKGEIEPWRLINVLQLAICGAWAFLILAMVVDIFLGDQGLVTAPHWSRPPMSRLSLEPHELGTPLGFPWYAGAKPWLPEQMAWHEEKREAMSGFISAPHSGQEDGGGGHSNIHKGQARRLSADVHASPARSALRDILELLPGSERAKEVPVQTVWPGFFEPRILACGPHGIAALSPRGVGALVPAAVAHHRAFEAARRFRLSGLTHLPPLLSAAFHPESQELMVVTRGGHVATCPDAGASPCAVHHAGLPVSAARAAAVAWMRDEASKEHHLHAAFIDEALPGLVAVFKLLGKGQASTWHPLGEFSAPFSDEVKEPLSAKVSLSFAPGEIVLTTAAGVVHRRRLQDGLLAESSHRFGGVSTVVQWQDACPMIGGGLAHLRLRRKEGSQAWTPELLTQKLEHTEGSGRLRR